MAVRKELVELGVDAGAGTIQWHLGRRGWRNVPAEATIWRTLVRRGFVVPEPRKRPKSSLRRFVASAPNELWQADCIDWVIVTGPARVSLTCQGCLATHLSDMSRDTTRRRATFMLPKLLTGELCHAAWRRGPGGDGIIGGTTRHSEPFEGKPETVR